MLAKRDGGSSTSILPFHRKESFFLSEITDPPRDLISQIHLGIPVSVDASMQLSFSGFQNAHEPNPHPGKLFNDRTRACVAGYRTTSDLPTATLSTFQSSKEHFPDSFRWTVIYFLLEAAPVCSHLRKSWTDH
jgi:hypothetical protein